MMSKRKTMYSILMLSMLALVGDLTHASLYFIDNNTNTLPTSTIVIHVIIYLAIALLCLFVWVIYSNKLGAYYEKQIEDEAAEEHERYIQAIKEGYKFYIHGQEVEPDKIVERVYELVYDNERKVVMGY